jgi:hypothetical protein
MEEKLE